MHYILTALKSEAKPIIDYYDLVFDNSHPIPIYKNDIYTLLITGVGKVSVYKACEVLRGNGGADGIL